MEPLTGAARKVFLSALAFAALSLCSPYGAAQEITEFPIPTADGPPALIVTGPDGNLWFTEVLDFQHGQSATDFKIGKITVNGAFTEFSLPPSPCAPRSIVAGPDGNLWYARFCAVPRVTAVFAGELGRITTQGASKEFLPRGGPWDITVGPDDSLWFANWLDGYAGEIDRLTTTGVITQYSIPTANSVPEGIVAGPDGNLWFTQSSSKIGRITPDGSITDFPLLSVNRDPV